MNKSTTKALTRPNYIAPYRPAYAALVGLLCAGAITATITGTAYELTKIIPSSSPADESPSVEGVVLGAYLDAMHLIHPRPRYFRIDDGVGTAIVTFRAEDGLTVNGPITLNGSDGTQLIINSHGIEHIDAAPRVRWAAQ